MPDAINFLRGLKKMFHIVVLNTVRRGHSSFFPQILHMSGNNNSKQLIKQPQHPGSKKNKQTKKQ